MVDEKKIKTTKVRFNYFKKCFLEYAAKFGLLGWDIYFAETDKQTEKASITYDYNVCNVTVSLNNLQLPSTDLRELARHEAIHLLLAACDFMATVRCVSSEELTRTNEEVTVKLTKLIP